MGFFAEFFAAFWGGVQAVDNTPVKPAAAKASGNLVYNEDKVIAMHFAVKMDGEEAGKIGLAGGFVTHESESGAFFYGRPVALNGKIGAAYEVLPGVEELTFYCDTPRSRGLRIIEVRSGSLKSQALAIYDALGKACFDRPTVEKQLVVYAAIQEANQVAQVNFTLGNRKGQIAQLYKFLIKDFKSFEIVEKGNPKFLEIPVNLDNCVSAGQIKDAASVKAASGLKSAQEIREAFARGEITQEEALKALGIKHAAPRTLKDVEKPVSADKADATSAASKPAPAPVSEPADDSDVDAGFDSGTPPQSAV
jgi:hypothetical protein